MSHHGNTVLVTGGAGFIGRHLVQHLLAHGEHVRILDRIPLQFDNVPPGAHIEAQCGDIRDPAAVARAVQGCREVYHVAAIPHLWVKPRGLLRRVNFHGAVNVLDAAFQSGARRVVHVSSDTITGWDNRDAVFRPWEIIGSYCRAKYLAERHARDLARQGRDVVIACPTVPVGPGDWLRSPPTQMLLDFCQSGRREYTDGQINLIDVRDVAGGLVQVMEYGEPGRRYVLGHEDMSLRELFQRMARIAGTPEPHRRIPYGMALAAGYVSEWLADVVTQQPPLATVLGVRLAQRPTHDRTHADLDELGIRPRPVDASLQETVAWFRDVGWLRRDGK